MKYPKIKLQWSYTFEDSQTLLLNYPGIAIRITREMVEDFVGICRGRKEFRKKVNEGRLIPKWYGYAYYSFDMDCMYFYPIPFNYIIGISRWLRYVIKYSLINKITHRDTTFHKGSYYRGYFKGIKVGKSCGIREGRRLENEEILERFDEGLEKRWGKYCEEQKDEPT